MRELLFVSDTAHAGSGRHPFCRYGVVLLCFFVLLGLAPRAAAQVVEAGLSGTVTDPSGAAVSGAMVAARDVETDVETDVARTAMTDPGGRYEFFALPVGAYEVTATKDGFQTLVRGGIELVVGQQAQVDLKLAVGAVSQKVTVNADAPVVSTTTTDISGLVGQQPIKDLPLNGRSYDLLMLLNPGVINFTWEKTGGAGISNSTTANNFAVSGNRPQQNLFLLNGIEFTGAAENNMTPGGASGQLLGIDAVREFNILRDGYSAEYGKKPGGQVRIVTQSGSNQWHGSVYEFLRNNALDTRNFFDAGPSAPPFQRNDFGVSMGGPVQKGKTFVFANYEGFRQNLHETSLAFVPDAATRADAVASVQPLLSLWPVAPAGAPDFGVTTPGCIPTPHVCDGVAQVSSSPLQTVREDFGTVRLDRVFSSKDNGSAIYTVDDSFSNTATPLDPYSADLLALREQVLSLQETHVVSASLLNAARFGFSRAGYYFAGEPTPGTPAASVPSFIKGLPVGAVVVGGSQASNPQAQLGLAGSNNGSNLHVARNLYTIADDLTYTKGRQQFRFGVWFQPFQSNEEIALSQYGQLTFTGIPNFVAGMATFLYDPAPTPLSWRSFFGAAYVEDEIRVRSNLTVTLGFREESSTGWHEAQGRAANYTTNPAGALVCASMSASNVCLPQVGSNLFSDNHEDFLPQPRAAIAWSPFDRKTVIRASFSMLNDLQDALGYRADQNAPFNPTYTIGTAAAPVSIASLGFPILPSAPPPTTPKALLLPGGVQQDLYAPTVLEYSLTIQRELSPNTSLSVAYVGNHGYHEIVGADANAPAPVVCPASPCPATFPTTDFPGTATPIYGALSGQPVPAGTLFGPTSTKPNANLATTWTWYSEGVSQYNALQADINHRFRGGLSFRGVYTWSKTLDDGDSLNATTSANNVALLSDPYDPKVDWGLASFDVRNSAAINASYLLPIGHGKRFAGNLNGVANEIVGGWALNSIIGVQSGFPFTPQLSYNPANNGDSRNPVRPFLNPTFSGPVVTGNPNQWFNTAAFIYPTSTSGFYGNVGRDTYTGPGLATWDFSTFKDTRISERFNLQFRAEIFNLLNRANFNTPNLIVAALEASPNTTIPEVSPTGGVITSTATSSRQVQFGLKLLW
jgi:Carboxypeptidase regulatory-like domain/TonB-dependent Receptor Plug Domain